MIKAWLFDLSRVLLFPVDKNYKGELNKLHKELSGNPNYSFWEHFYLDENELSFLDGFKDKHDLYMFTSGTIQNAPEIRPRLDAIFKKIYSAEEIGLTKKDSKAYEFIAEDLGCTPDEICYIDDSEENVKAARTACVNVRLYRDFDKLKKDLEETLSSN